jgi:cytoskeletal protein CcmA (bactofilin family)
MGMVLNYYQHLVITTKGLLSLGRAPFTRLLASLRSLLIWPFSSLVGKSNHKKDTLTALEQRWENKPGASRKASNRKSTTVIGEDLSLETDIVTDGDVTINGEILGDVRCASLEVDKNARISGNVSADRMTLRGRVDHSVRAENIMLHSSSCIRGDLIWKSIKSRQGAQVLGRSYPPYILDINSLDLFASVARKPRRLKTGQESAFEHLFRNELVGEYKGMVFITINGLLEHYRCSFCYLRLLSLFARYFGRVERCTNEPHETGKSLTSQSAVEGPTEKVKKKQKSIIGQDISLTCDIITNGELQIDGQVYGDVHCDSLIVGKKALVLGRIVANDITIRGYVEGRIEGERVVLKMKSHVEGDIFSNSLETQIGSVFNGRCHRGADQFPMKASDKAHSRNKGSATHQAIANHPLERQLAA